MIFKINREIYEIENFEKFPEEDKEDIKRVLGTANSTLISVVNSGVFLERGQIIQAYRDTLEDEGFNNLVFKVIDDIIDLEVGGEN